MLYYENKLKREGSNLIIGVDEAGRGPLAGPVVAAAVSLVNAHFKNRIDDSKRLTKQQREKAFVEIVGKSLFGIGVVNEKIIDRLNILKASLIAMELAVNSLLKKCAIRTYPKIGRREETPSFETGSNIHLLIDGNVRPDIDLPITCIVRGDSKSKSIACASILAKVTRDRIMTIYDRVYPEYGFIRHKGYPTKIHKAALENFGPSIIHRMSFNGV